MKRLVLCTAAHVDAGKTTLTEAMLFCAGKIRRFGRVDNKDAYLDNNPLERSRGITIFSKQAIMHIGDTEFTVVDTPGHIDFAAETERAFAVPDCAVLVISGTDGIQSHTETLWRMLRRAELPVFVFVNKMDISEKSHSELLEDLCRLDRRFAEISESNIAEKSAEFDEDCMNSLLNSGSIPEMLISKAIAERKFFPVCFGSALKNIGISESLDLLEKYASPKFRSENFAALVYKITYDENNNRLTHLKINGGELKVRSVIDNSGEKINQIRIYSGAKYDTADTAFPGQVCAVTGLTKTYAGQVLGVQPENPKPISAAPLSYKIILPENTDASTAFPLMKRLEEEDPQLHFSTYPQTGEIKVNLMGEIQLEVLKNVISQRFGMDVDFGEGSIAYKETILEPVEGVGHFEPLRHYAEVHLLLEPLPAGSGVVFARDCNNPDESWQRLIMSVLREKEHIGVLTGSPITDIKITLKAFKAHLKHTEGGDFRQAALRAVRQGLACAKSQLLEPYFDFRLKIPESSVGRALNDLQLMSAEFTSPEPDGEFCIIEGSCPVSEMQSYHRTVIGYTHGKGVLTVSPKGCFPCHNSAEVIEKIGYNFESDTENTADSIFCSHGAGRLVKWNEVSEYMHLPSVISARTAEPVSRTEISSYKARAATDKELIEIFERTYGKISRPKPSAMRRTEKPETSCKVSPPPAGEKYLLVDGYNIIFSWDELAQLARESLDCARSELINILCNYQGFRQCNVIIVFDAYKVKSDREIEEYGGVTVVYTKESETADTYIEKTSHKLSKDNYVRVATSDGAEQMIVLGNGALRVSAREFKAEVDEVISAIREILNKM